MENIKRLSKKLITFFPHKNFLKLFPKSISLGYTLIFSSRERPIYTHHFCENDFPKFNISKNKLAQKATLT